MKKLNNIVLILLISLLSNTVYSQNVEQIRNTGPADNRINIVFLGDGYRQQDLPTYEADVQKILNAILSESPFDEYSEYFNAYRVDVVSNESGADHPENSPATEVDTALNSTYNCNNIERLICADNTLVTQAAERAPVAATPGFIIVIVNDTKRGGAGGSFSVISRHSDGEDIALHEIGHSFANLADEYVDSNITKSTTEEPNKPNVTIETVRANIKWKHWISESTSIPTTTTTNGVPGLYESAYYMPNDIYRPTNSSKMRSSSRPFEQINTEQIILQMYNSVSPIDSYSPAGSNVSINFGNSRTFTIDTMQKATEQLSVNWYANGYKVGSGTSYTLRTGFPGSQPTNLKAIVSDPTSMVRSDPEHLLIDQVSWNIHVDTRPSNGACDWSFVSAGQSSLDGLYGAEYQPVGECLTIRKWTVQNSYTSSTTYENPGDTVVFPKSGCIWENRRNYYGYDYEDLMCGSHGRVAIRIKGYPHSYSSSGYSCRISNIKSGYSVKQYVTNDKRHCGVTEVKLN